MANDQTRHYRFGYGWKELERLEKQHRVWADDNRRLLNRAGFGAGATLVDLGCGPGYTTFELAHLVGPEGQVIAVDRDGERSLPLLKERAAAAGLSNIEIRIADLEMFDLPDGSVDGVFGRWVLMYLPQRMAEKLTGRVARWLRPGGACTLLEFCNYRHIHIHPPCVDLPVIAEALFQAVKGNSGCNPEIGNDLPGLLHAAGLVVELNVVTKTVRATTPEWQWPDALFRDHLQDLVKEGYLNRGVLDAFFMEWEERSKDPNALFFGSPVIEAIGRRV
jgi:ubiquinone/menaquinone biosynthesis C-methylase UbiE